MAAPCGAIAAAPLGKCPPQATSSCHSHQIDAGDELGDRMLDLQARVHFHEIELLRRVHQELDGARAHIADGARRGDGGLRHGGANLRSSPGAGASSMIF